MQAGYTMGMAPSGRESLVVAIKGTFNLPFDGSEPKLLPQQLPLVEADVYTGEPGLSSPLYEVDYAPFKPRCDVLLNGSAYAPDGRPVKKLPVSLQVGSMKKEFNVVGDRTWQVSMLGYSHSSPKPFTTMPISYDSAFGGSDNLHPDESKHTAHMLNPVGNGYHGIFTEELMDGQPLPNTEECGKSIKFPNGKYRPMAFGVVGRGWQPRYPLAGTYDQNWIDNIFPFLPDDFQEAYYQCAPLDQQIDFLMGDEIVDLINLTPEGHSSFKIPAIEVPVVFFRKKGEREETHAVADTLVIEPDLNRFSITWRASIPLKKNMFEIPQVLVGKMSRAWWRARELGKTYYPSLAHVAKANRVEEEEA